MWQILCDNFLVAEILSRSVACCSVVILLHFFVLIVPSVSGKGLLTKFARKSSAVDENRRATYNISNQPVVRPDSIFMTFESEIKQLVAV